MFQKIALALTALLTISTIAEACPGGLRPFDKKLGGKDTCVLEGTYVGNLELASGFNYILLGAVFVGSEERNSNLELLKPIESGNITVYPGVTIYALNPSKDKTGVWAGFKTKGGDLVKGDIKTFLSVTRDSKIIVKGESSSPVLMTSAQGEHQAQPTFTKRPGDWGGLVISGKAKSNKCGDFASCTLPGEANTGYYGGDDEYHSSGSIQYLQVEYGGDRIDNEKELNGITFNSIGLGTEISNIAVLYNADDCIEFFGGAATAMNVFCYKGEDDGIDTTDGARVFLQNGVVVAADYPNAGEDNDRHMVEADSSKTLANTLKLRSHPVLVNFTFVGGKNSQGMMLRLGTNYTLKNSIMTGVDTWCMKNNDANDFFFSTNLFADCPSNDLAASVSGNKITTAAALGLNRWVPGPNASVLEGAEYLEEFFPDDEDLDEAFYDVYDEVDYIGGVGEEDWTQWIQLRD